jgi:hypothetical protein
MDGVDLRNRFKRAYYLVQCVRRILFVAIGLFLNEEKMAGPQLVLVFLINLFTMMYMGKAQALIGININRIDIFNETILAIISFFTVAFTDFA